MDTITQRELSWLLDDLHEIQRLANSPVGEALSHAIAQATARVDKLSSLIDGTGHATTESKRLDIAKVQKQLQGIEQGLDLAGSALNLRRRLAEDPKLRDRLGETLVEAMDREGFRGWSEANEALDEFARYLCPGQTLYGAEWRVEDLPWLV